MRLGNIGELLHDRIKRHFAEREIPVTVKYIDPSYMIRSAPANASDSIYCQELGQCSVHAAMAGKTQMMVGRVHSQLVHVPISQVTSGRKKIDPEGGLWRSVLQSTGQPARMTNNT